VRSTRQLDAAEFLLEPARDLLRDRKIDRGVPDHLAFFPGRLDQLRCDRLGRRRIGAHGGCEHGAERKPARALQRALQNVAPGKFSPLHRVLRLVIVIGSAPGNDWAAA
jgi:hypothetical protein